LDFEKEYNCFDFELLLGPKETSQEFCTINDIFIRKF